MAEHVTRDRPALLEHAKPSWWARYAESLDASSISPTSRAVIQADSRYIVEKGIFGAGDPADGQWPEGRARQGIVMGAVQSGKTASMLGVAALSIDSGVDMIVVLAGTRLALWRQTLERLLNQLDRIQHSSVADRVRRRILVPEPEMAMNDDESLSPSQLYALSGPSVTRAIARRRPIVVVALKNAHHLRALTGVIRESVIPAIDRSARPFHVLVLDDEADDGSILDARVEQRLDPTTDDLKQIPRAIVDLWETRPHTGQTALDWLFATYVGYTATPQANFLQSDHNPLAPKDFSIALRTPLDQGELEPRSSTYREPAGLAASYTGGEAFYRRLRGSGVCQPTTSNPSEDLADAVRAFLVSAATRLDRDRSRLSPRHARETVFSSREEAASRSPKPHSMLFHPSAAIADQFEAAAALLAIVCGLDRTTSRQRIDAGERGLPVADIERMIAANETAWTRWLGEYRASADAVESAFDLPQPRSVPDASRWAEIRNLILHEVVPATQIKIVNSDPGADDRPQFDPSQDEAGGWRGAEDLCTIFVSGNVMSRGLTLEGLTTTLFLRTSDDPYADTQMQMQRWFGYRGAYLELCRVFLPAPQLELFRAYHDTDEALRRSVLHAMNEAAEEGPAPMVLQGHDFSATGKLVNVSNVPLCPGATPFIRLTNSGEDADPNVELIARTFGSRPSQDLDVRGLRGRILLDPLPLVEAADLIDKLRYQRHRPTATGWEGARWKDLEPKVGITPETDAEGLLPFFRPPVVAAEEATPYARGGPYAIAAYLRLWAACLTRHARGLVATESPSDPWSLVDLDKKLREQPAFYVGIRYGSGSAVEDGPLGELPFRVRTMKRDVDGDKLSGSWGTRNPRPAPGHYLGDELFDYHFHGHTPPITPRGVAAWRPVGSPGLILLHVIERDDRPFPTVAVGVALPVGGPDQFAARYAQAIGTRP